MSRPLSFLHLTTFYPPYSFGGDAMFVYRLAHALGDAGHSVDVVHCVDSYHLLHPGPPELAFEGHPNVTVHGLRSRFGPLSPLATQQTGRPLFKLGRLREILSSRPFDVIHFHNASLFGPAALSLNPAYGQALKLYTTHEHWLVCPMHVLWKYGQRACEKPACLRCTLAGRRPPQLWRYTDLLERSSQAVDSFVSPSRFTARMHAERGFSRPLGLLPYFIDRVDHEWQRPGPRPQPEPYFLFVGRLERIKGLHTLIDVWPSAPAVDLLVAGSGGDEAALRARAAGNPRIRFLGPRSQRELGALYVHALATILPSITYEVFPMVTLESFARRTPIVVRDLGGMPEAVEESGGGFVYRNDVELIQALEQIAASPELRGTLGERGYQAFLQRWTREAHMRQYFGLLDQLASQKYGKLPWLEPAGIGG